MVIVMLMVTFYDSRRAPEGGGNKRPQRNARISAAARQQGARTHGAVGKRPAATGNYPWPLVVRRGTFQLTCGSRHSTSAAGKVRATPEPEFRPHSPQLNIIENYHFSAGYQATMII